MPIEELHKKKFTKNIAMLGLVLGFAALIWGITMVKLATGH
jgi:hypothetical protein